MIYFIGQENSRYIKIGYSKNIGTLKTRMLSMQTGNPHSIELVGFVEGGYNEEHAFHSKFESLRVLGEWFRNDGALCEFMSETDFELADLDSIEEQPGFRKNIYIKNIAIWNEVGMAAKLANRSISGYLIDCHKKCKDRPFR